MAGSKDRDRDRDRDFPWPHLMLMMMGTGVGAVRMQCITDRDRLIDRHLLYIIIAS